MCGNGSKKGKPIKYKYWETDKKYPKIPRILRDDWN